MTQGFFVKAVEGSKVDLRFGQGLEFRTCSGFCNLGGVHESAQASCSASVTSSTREATGDFVSPMVARTSREQVVCQSLWL